MLMLLVLLLLLVVVVLFWRTVLFKLRSGIPRTLVCNMLKYLGIIATYNFDV